MVFGFWQKMMSYLEKYIQGLSNQGLKQTVRETVANVQPKIEAGSVHKKAIGMLLGNVQSGKTGQMFGIIASSADIGYKVFLLLTTDNVALQQQTYERALSSFEDFNVCTETDYTRFQICGIRKPLLIVLKKNSSVLKTWKKQLASSQFCKGIPLFIVDDEADASSLNTKVNKNEQSKINALLDDIRGLSSASIYLQVTATPQAILLQTKISQFKPDFYYYFKPGANYLGGDFFYNEKGSYAVKITSDNELSDVRDDGAYIPDGLKQSVLSFLVTAAQIKLSGGQVCNFLIHPSVRTDDHNATARKIEGFLNTLIYGGEIMPYLKDSWEDIQKTKPDILEFEAINSEVQRIIENEEVNVHIMNCQNSCSKDKYQQGNNIIIGGNSLGRGVTFPALQTVYYCRTSKTPQADTYWQHCRMFGYDRDPGLMRVYLPAQLFKLFKELNAANTALIKQLENRNLSELMLLYPPNIKPTRMNVVDKGYLNMIVGGVNYFPSFVKEDNLESLDKILYQYKSSSNSIEDVEVDVLINILEKITVERNDDWSKLAFVNALKAWKTSKEPGATKAKLIIRENRDIAKSSGTLLSENDRMLGDKIKDLPVLTMYRVNGSIEKGWNGCPVWIPNIKFPEGKSFFRSEG